MKIHHFKFLLCLVITAMLGVWASLTWAEKPYYWEKTFGEGVGNSAQQTFDGGYIVAGRLLDSACLIKTDADGKEMWIKTFGDGDAISVQQTTDGGYIFIRQGDCYVGAHLTKTNPEGTSMWTQEVAGYCGWAPSVQQTKDGGYILGVNRFGGSEQGWFGYLVKIDDKGDKLWRKYLGEHTVGSVQQTADGGYIILYGGLLKTDADGNEIWRGHIGGKSVKQTIDGGYIVVGDILIKTDPDGNTLWIKNINGLQPCNSVQQTTDGGYIVIRDKLIKTDADGNELWRKNISGNSVQQTTDGGYIITGEKSYPQASGSELYMVYYKPPGIVNEHVSFSPIESTYQTTSDTYGCPAGCIGKFSFDAALANEIGYELWNLVADIAQLSNGNVLLTDEGFIGVGEQFEIPKKDAYEDGKFSPGESFDVPFTVCLKNMKPFKFYVNVLLGDVKQEQEDEIWEGNYYIFSLENVLALSGYTSVTGSLQIRHTSLTSLGVGLNSLLSVGEGLFIDDNVFLTSLEDLNNIISVGYFLSIENNDSLTSLEGLDNITSVGILSIENNDSLTNLEGLNNITSVGTYLSIGNNDSLINLEGLNNLTSAEDVFIDDNDSLTSLEGLNSLSPVGILSIGNNDSLINLEGLNNLTSAEDVFIDDNDSLTSLEGLNNITSVGSPHLSIGNNDSLISLEALSNITSVGGDLDIWDNDSLTSLEGLNNITSVAWSLDIGNNDSLTSLEALSNITSVGRLSIENNDSLTSLGLYSLNIVDISFYIIENIKLCTPLAEELRDQVLNGGGIGGEIVIRDNKTCP